MLLHYRLFDSLLLSVFEKSFRVIAIQVYFEVARCATRNTFVLCLSRTEIMKCPERQVPFIRRVNTYASQNYAYT